MIKEFEPVVHGLLALINEWEPLLVNIPTPVLLERRNTQNRNIKQILGHLIDSASNNTHRIIHLQYQASPFHFPNYATHGNNDRWIAIQNYNDEDWNAMVALWKSVNLHIIHVIRHVEPSKLQNQWYYSDEKLITLKDGIVDYLRHFQLHLSEIQELMQRQN